MRRRGFEKTEKTPLDCDLLIIDEASMIDTLLMRHLLKAIPVTGTLILVGDANQLPSVGPGNVLKDIIESGLPRWFSLMKFSGRPRKFPLSSVPIRSTRGVSPI